MSALTDFGQTNKTEFAMLNQISARSVATIQSFKNRQEGATAVEYALIAGVLALIIAAAFFLLGDGYTEALGNVIDEMSEPTRPGAG